MGLFDKFKDTASEHGDKVNDGLDKAGDVVSDKTGGKYDDKIEGGKDAVSGHLGTDDGGESGSGDGDNGGDNNGGENRGGDNNNA